MKQIKELPRRDFLYAVALGVASLATGCSPRTPEESLVSENPETWRGLEAFHSAFDAYKRIADEYGCFGSSEFSAFLEANTVGEIRYDQQKGVIELLKRNDWGSKKGRVLEDALKRIETLPIEWDPEFPPDPLFAVEKVRSFFGKFASYGAALHMHAVSNKILVKPGGGNAAEDYMKVSAPWIDLENAAITLWHEGRHKFDSWESWGRIYPYIHKEDFAKYLETEASCIYELMDYFASLSDEGALELKNNKVLLNPAYWDMKPDEQTALLSNVGKYKRLFLPGDQARSLATPMAEDNKFDGVGEIYTLAAKYAMQWYKAPEQKAMRDDYAALCRSNGIAVKMDDFKSMYAGTYSDEQFEKFENARFLIDSVRGEFAHYLVGPVQGYHGIPEPGEDLPMGMLELKNRAMQAVAIQTLTSLNPEMEISEFLRPFANESQVVENAQGGAQSPEPSVDYAAALERKETLEAWGATFIGSGKMKAVEGLEPNAFYVYELPSDGDESILYVDFARMSNVFKSLGGNKWGREEYGFLIRVPKLTMKPGQGDISTSWTGGDFEGQILANLALSNQDTLTIYLPKYGYVIDTQLNGVYVENELLEKQFFPSVGMTYDNGFAFVKTDRPTAYDSYFAEVYKGKVLVRQNDDPDSETLLRVYPVRKMNSDFLGEDILVFPTEGRDTILIHRDNMSEVTTDGSFGFWERQSIPIFKNYPGTYSLTGGSQRLDHDALQITVRPEDVEKIDVFLLKYPNAMGTLIYNEVGAAIKYGVAVAQPWYEGDENIFVEVDDIKAVDMTFY